HCCPVRSHSHSVPTRRSSDLKVPGVLLVMNHVINHAEHSCPIAAHKLVECFGVISLASSHQVQFRYIGLSRSRFRLHDWTGPRPDRKSTRLNSSHQTISYVVS